MSAGNWHVKVPSASWRLLAAEAERITDRGDFDLDLAERIANVRVKPWGRGYQVWIPVDTPEDLERLGELLELAGDKREGRNLRSAARTLQDTLDSRKDQGT